MSDEGADSRGRPPAPAGAVLVVTASFLSTLLAMFVGGGLVVAGHRAEQDIARAGRARAARDANRERIASAQGLLDELASRIAAQFRLDGYLPDMLPEAPPPDPWGTPVRYLRVDGDRAELRSAGPDARFRTRDDLVRTLGR